MARKRRKAEERRTAPELAQIFPEVPRPELSDADREKLRQVLEEIARLGAKETKRS